MIKMPKYHLPYGTSVEVCNIKDEDDLDLNGLVGILVKKWTFDNPDPRLTFGDVGVVVHRNGKKIKANLRHGEYKRAT